jgi:hypothetical protein
VSKREKEVLAEQEGKRSLGWVRGKKKPWLNRREKEVLGEQEGKRSLG